MKKDKEEGCSSSEEVVVVITSNYSNLHPCSLLQCLFRACLSCLGLMDDNTPVNDQDPPAEDGSTIGGSAYRRRPPRTRPDPGPGGQINVARS